MQRFWMVWQVGGRFPTVKHSTEESAEREAMRLAAIAPSSTFVVLETVTSFQANSVVRTNLRDLPF